MNLRKKLIQLYFSNDLIYNCFYLFNTIYKVLYSKVFSDKYVIKKKFYKVFNYRLDIEHPKTFNEKMQWLKIYSRNKLEVICADKYKVRNFVKDIIGDKYLVPLVFSTKDVSLLSAENMPNYPIIIKSNHDSGGFKIIFEKGNVEWNAIRKFFKRRLRENYYYSSREWQYKDIERCIVIEKLLYDGVHKVNDFKFHCSNGKVFLIAFGQRQEEGFRKYSYYYPDFKPLGRDFNWGYSTENYLEIDKPSFIDEMIVLAEKLANDFIYVRVDFLELNGAFYFGELTFQDDGGFGKISPSEYDRILGDKLVLPIDKK